MLQNFTMPLPKKETPLEKTISIRVTQADYDALTSIPDYREKLRDFIQKLINSQEQEKKQ
ncbi:hypothetical protein CAL7716_043680 [Calothrix sp. PCC 7716]|nr:hypothetical protein CAL7716_043680 [Calothrix sp. PCC 7716]